jgi:hypothetical protein
LTNADEHRSNIAPHAHQPSFPHAHQTSFPHAPNADQTSINAPNPTNPDDAQQTNQNKPTLFHAAPCLPPMMLNKPKQTNTVACCPVPSPDDDDQQTKTNQHCCMLPRAFPR